VPPCTRTAPHLVPCPRKASHLPDREEWCEACMGACFVACPVCARRVRESDAAALEFDAAGAVA